MSTEQYTTQKYSDEDCEEALRLYHQGLSWSDVADRMGAPSASAMRKAATRYRNNPKRCPDAAPTEPTPPAPTRFPDWQQPEIVDWRDWFKAWEKTLELHKRIDPTQEFLTVDFSQREEPIAIVSASDLHMGGGFSSHAAIRRTIEFVLDTPRLYIGITGDSIEGFIAGVKPAETVEQQAGSVKAQIGALNSLVTELGEARKILWMTWGDHDGKWFEQAIGLNVIKQEVHDRVPYFTGRGLITLKLADQEYFVMVNHAERFNSQWNKNHPARRQYERFFPADVNITAHKHKPAFQMDWHYEALREAGLNVGGKHWLVTNGTFKTGPDPYTIRSWSRGVIGTPTIVFYPDRHDVDVLETPEKAALMLRALEAA